MLYPAAPLSLVSNPWSVAIQIATGFFHATDHVQLTTDYNKCPRRR